MSGAHMKGVPGGVVPAPGSGGFPGPGTGSGGSDRTSFLGHKVPEEVRRMLELLPRVDKPTFRGCLTAAMSALEWGRVDGARLGTLVGEGRRGEGLSEENVAVLVTGLHQLLQRAVRLSNAALKPETLTEDLSDLKLSKEFIADIVSAVFGQRRASLERRAADIAPRLPQMLALRWRVDVAISTSVLSRVLQPSVTLEMDLSDGSTRSFEVPVSRFHELRYNVAAVLKDMEDLEKRSILKIAN